MAVGTIGLTVKLLFVTAANCVDAHTGNPPLLEHRPRAREIGITVGVLSDTYDNFDTGSYGPPLTTAADDVASGDLPPVVDVLQEGFDPGIDEGHQKELGLHSELACDVERRIVPGRCVWKDEPPESHDFIAVMVAVCAYFDAHLRVSAPSESNDLLR